MGRRKNHEFSVEFYMMFFVLTLFVGVFSVQYVDIFVHSHCDPGWLETTDMYFDERVKPIMDNNIDYLMNHPEAKYNFVESIYLNMWWEQASDTKKKQLLHLIHETKQWEIQMGGWVMNDQACPTYSSSIDQLTLGHMFLQENMQVTPVEGWTLDPFGQTPTQVYLYALAGFKYQAQWRISYTEMKEYEHDQTLEFWWGDDNDIVKPLFTHILDMGYGGPGGFQFWNGGSGNPPITPSNIKDRASVLIKLLDSQSNNYRSEQNLLVMWGGDFAITHPSWVFGNTTLLMDYINKDETYGKKYQLRYSTATEYLDAVSTEIGSKIPTRKDKDFFVYDDNEFGYWSGYFTSQPRMKLKSREGEWNGRIGELVYSSAYLMNQATNFSFFSSPELDAMFQHLKLLRAKNGQILHHDAITGTEKWHVSDFYVAELDDAMGLVDEVTRTLFSYICCPTWCKGYGRMAIVLPSLIDWQVNYGDRVGFFSYNPLGWPVSGEAQTFTFGTPAREGTYEVQVTDLTGKVKYPTSILSHDSEMRTSTITFESGVIPPAGFSYYVLNFTKKISSDVQKEKKTDNYSISNGVYEIQFDPTTKKMSKITTPKTSMSVTLDFEYYTSYASGMYDHLSDEEERRQRIEEDPSNGQNSGAYIFRPVSDETNMVTSTATLDITENDVFVEARQQFDDYIDIGIRLYKHDSKFSNFGKNVTTDNRDFMEIVYYKVGVLPPDHEVVVTLQTEIQNNQELYHDELALDLKKKVFMKKSDPGITAAANHYPTQYAAGIRDGQHALTIVSSKSGSASSMKEGRLEVMIHRSCSKDDSKGVNQPLLDKFVITEDDNFRMRISLDSDLSSAEMFRHKHSYRINHQPKIYPFHPNYWNVAKYPDDFRDSFSLLKNEEGLKENIVHLLSMNKIEVGEDVGFVMRVNHLMNAYEPDAKEESVSVDDILGKFDIKEMNEMKLTLLDKVDGEENVSKDSVIDLKPIEIRTYQVKF